MSDVLQVTDLHVEVTVGERRLHPVDGVDLRVDTGETVALVGESGSGKTTLALAIMGLLPRGMQVVGGEVHVDGHDVLSLRDRELDDLRGRVVAMVFQDPATSLDPVQRIVDQVAEARLVHRADRSRREARASALRLLESVGFPDPPVRGRSYPHELSGGMCQRVVIAMAVANRPRLLLADEPTSALDVTVQAQVLETLATARRETGAGMLLITHDLGVVAEHSDRVAVMYSGHIVEEGDVAAVLAAPRHPYTRALLAARLEQSRTEAGVRRLRPIPGMPTALTEVPGGCPFHPRCDVAVPRCAVDRPELAAVGAPGRRSACWVTADLAAPAPAARS